MSARRGGEGRRPARAPSRHRWVVESIADEVAALEEDGERRVHVPAWLLPDDAREGSVLEVWREGTAVHLRLDDAAEREALERSRRQVGEGRGEDPGGAIEL